MDVTMKRSELKLPSELLEMFPNCGLNTKEIGYLVTVGAVTGVKWKGQRSSWIDPVSFKNYIEYKKTVNNLKSVEFDNIK